MPGLTPAQAPVAPRRPSRLIPLAASALLILALPVLPLAPALAQTGFYIGGNIGQSYYKESSPLTAPIEGSTTGFKAYVGYRLTPGLSVELGHAVLGTFSAGGDSLRGSGGFFDAVLTLPLANQWSVLGRVGAFDNRAYKSVNGNTTLEKAINVKLGGGLQYDFNATTAIRGEWERYGQRVNQQTANTDLYSLGVLVRF